MSRVQPGQHSLGNGLPSGGRFGGSGGGGGSSSSSSFARSPPSNSAFSSSLQAALNPSTGAGSEDFPALSPSTAPQSATSTASLFSYASQAGHPTPLSNGSLPPGMSTSQLLSSVGQPQQPREFSPDDFPVLGGGSSSNSTANTATTTTQAQSQSQPPPPSLGSELAALSAGLNGMSLAGRSAAVAAAGQGQEQASALAALQAQQQHRASLLGAMNGSPVAGGQRQVSIGGQQQHQSDKQQQQPWASSPSPAPSSFPSSLLSNGTTPGSAASSPLPPSSVSSTTLLDQIRSSNSSNNGSSGGAGGGGGLPGGAAAILAQAQQQQREREQQSQQRPSSPPPSSSSTTTSQQQQQQQPSSNLPSSSPFAAPAPPNNTSQQSGTTPTTTTTGGGSGGSLPQTPAQQVLFSPADRFGLIGLLHIIKSATSDVGMLALGNDLTNLGLDLGAPDNLYSSFITPWSDSKAAQMLNIEPEFHLPSCYNVQPPAANTKIGNFSDETLFFIFYSQPRDMMQEMAAHELYKHNWRYHKELKLWLTKEAGTEPVQKTATYERGSYIFFDPVLWERVRRDFILQFDQLETRRA